MCEFNGISHFPFNPVPIRPRTKNLSIDPHYEVKNINFLHTLINITIRLVLVRGFQIVSQNSNQKTFNQHFPKKKIKI